MNHRLLFVVNELDFFISHRLPIALELKKQGCDVHIATAPASNQSIAHVEECGLTFHEVCISRRGLNPWKEVCSLIRLVKLFKKVKPSLVHLVTVKPVTYGGIAARLTGVPAMVAAISGLGTVFIRQGLKMQLIHGMVLWLYRCALNHPNSCVIFQNIEDLQVFRTHHIAKSARPLLTPGSGVDAKQFNYSEEPENDSPIVMMASRMLKSKGVVEFVQACRILKKRGVKAQYVLVGNIDPGNPDTLLKKDLTTWQQEGIIQWWGKKSQMHAILPQANVVCLPSFYREGLPKVLIEAAACGRAIVTTNIAGCRDIVRHNHNGLVVPTRNAHALADAIESLVTAPKRRHAMGKAGRQMVESSFTVESVIEQTIQAYRQLSFLE